MERKIIMTQEDKELLLKDLCARLPYGVMIQIPELFYPQRKVAEKLVTINDLWHFNDDGTYIENVKPYLRPMSSMTENEKKELYHFYCKEPANNLSIPNLTWELRCCISDSFVTDWLNEHHFDYRRLIERGLALEAPEGIYNIN